MSHELWQTIWLSLRVSLMATCLAAVVGTSLAYVNARSRYWGRSLVEALIVIPMVLPPTVVGYLIIAMLGSRGWLGQYLYQWFSYSVLFRVEGAVLAGTIVALPLLYLPTRAAFSAVEKEMEDTARLMGANTIQIFWHVSLPMARRGLASGLMLAFARAMGEFGATVMVFGIRMDRTTLPVSIYLDYEGGEMNRAWPAVFVLCAASIVITLVYNRSALAKQD